MHIGNLNQNNDQGIWLEQNVNVKVNNSWSLIFNHSERWGNDYKRFWYFRHWYIAQYDLTPLVKDLLCIPQNSLFVGFTIGPGFSEVWSIQRNTRGIVHWEHSYRPNLVAFMTHSWHGWSLQQRMVGEYVGYFSKHYRAHAFYRHRAVLHTPWKWTCFHFNPFISNEWFLREESKDGKVVIQSGPFYDNRFRLGIAFDLMQHFTAQLWWQLRMSKQLPGSNPLWRKTYQIGLTLNLNF